MSKYSEDTKAAVYGLREKGQNKYFYVGCTVHNPQSRLRRHIEEAIGDYHSNKHFANKVKKIGADNIVCDILEETLRGQHFAVEKKWIKKLKADGHKLVNKIHNEPAYRYGYSQEPSAETRKKARRFLDGPMPEINHPVPEIKQMLQSLLQAYKETILVLEDRLIADGYDVHR